MKLRVKDAAVLLSVSEKTIYRLVGQSKLPFHQVNHQVRFNRAELIEWATTNRMPVSPEMPLEPDDASFFSLAKALELGGIHYRVQGRDKASVLRSIVDILDLPREMDRDFLYQVLLARESLGSTAIGNGIAIPHARNPITLHVRQPIVALCFLEHPIDFEAIDHRPVHTLFTIVSPTITAHLNLLSKLSFGLRTSGFAQAVARIGSREELLAEAGRLEDQLTHPKTMNAPESPS